MVYLSVNPHEFAHFAVRVSIVPLSMAQIISELPLVDFPIRPGKFAPAIFEIFIILSLKLISIRSFPLSFSLPLAVSKVTFINTSVFPIVSAKATKLAILELSGVSISVRQLLATLPMF